MPGSPFTIYDGPSVIRQQGTMTGGGDSVGGVTVSGTPTATQVLTATSATTATWQAGGGGSLPVPFTAAAGIPTGSVTPAQVGALYVDTTNGGLYIAVGATDSDWVVVGGSDGGGGLTPGVAMSGHNINVLAGDNGQASLTDVTNFNGVYYASSTDEVTIFSALLGAYGKTPGAAKAAHPTTLADVITILQNLNLCA